MQITVIDVSVCPIVEPRSTCHEQDSALRGICNRLFSNWNAEATGWICPPDSQLINHTHLIVLFCNNDLTKRASCDLIRRLRATHNVVALVQFDRDASGIKHIKTIMTPAEFVEILGATRARTVPKERPM